MGGEVVNHDVYVCVHVCVCACKYVRHTHTQVRMVSSMLLWFASSFAYYGLSLSVGSLGGSVYDGAFYNSLLELPSNVAAAVMVENRAWGRRMSTGLACLIAGACCVVGSMCTPASPHLMAAAFAGKFFVTAAFAIAFLYGAELFPTGSRSSGMPMTVGLFWPFIRSLLTRLHTSAMGLLSLSARLGGILAPFVPKSASGQILFALPLLVAALAMTRLPETLGKPLPTSLIDIDLSKESFTPSCCRSYQRMGDEDEEGAEMKDRHDET